ncbi:MAG: hypothetical protein O2816_09580 [Planctomycetota bacterium]|nr:hypothetical protein [Planctomycetota bacterium]
MEPEAVDVGFELLKYTLLLGSFPFWGPFAKALWEEFLLALRPDGGLSGKEPTARERRAIEDRIARDEPMRQVHEPLAHLRAPGSRKGDGSEAIGGPSGSLTEIGRVPNAGLGTQGGPRTRVGGAGRRELTRAAGSGGAARRRGFR